MQIRALILSLVLLRIALSGFCDFEPVYSRQVMVVSPEPHATQTGLEVLRQGGNAFDAAVAVGFALAVTYPQAGNIGGGGFLVGLTADGERIALDFRETAPAAASRDMYLDATGSIIPDLSTKSMLAVGVPGTVHGLLSALERYGTLSRDQVIAPAIRLAQDGFPVNTSLEWALQESREELICYDSTAKVFYQNGHPLSFGSTLKQPDLARTLEIIRDMGIDGFYRGPVADALVATMQKYEGIITHNDLERYTSKFREALTFNYRNYQLVTHPLPSSGGITMAQILKLIEPFHVHRMGFHSAECIQTLVEAERMAFADRNFYLGDSDFVQVPVERLLSDEYLAQRRRAMPWMKAGRSVGVSHGPAESAETTHFCVVDGERNVVAVTYTLNGIFGMGVIVEGAGFFLNNEMDDFSAKPGEANMYGLVQAEANAIAPGKRMLSSMCPTIVLKEGKFAFTMGTPGGPTIITTNVQIFLNQVEFGMNIREAIDARRFHHQWLPDEISHEPFAFSPDTAQRLREMGYQLKETPQIGFAGGIQLTNDGLLAGYSDGRGEGLAAGF